MAVDTFSLLQPFRCKLTLWNSSVKTRSFHIRAQMLSTCAFARLRENQKVFAGQRSMV
ncbi:hypothetical protein SAMN04488498_109206 [Mesorhizobium albiziae]|uniref:Uncharacterized protein n=1 Tax=Neomesorhizobium albiziae TaxID=335020 RepID=A0A1I4B534_9HYPH|nr:hypothetical protein SAMN04488498_109206 [Mesorhizobium albiziae]